MKTSMLDGVSAGFVKRVARLDVSIQLRPAVSAHVDIGGAQVQAESLVRAAQQRQAGIDLVGAIAQAEQHLGSFGGVSRFGQDLPLQGHRGIGSDHKARLARRPAPGCSRDQRFFARQAQHILAWVFAQQRALVNIGRGSLVSPTSQG